MQAKSKNQDHVVAPETPASPTPTLSTVSSKTRMQRFKKYFLVSVYYFSYISNILIIIKC